MQNELIIKILKDSKGNPVSLDNISVDSADALKIFIESFSEYARLNGDVSDIKISLRDGSISTVLSYPETNTIFQEGINDVVNNRSENRDRVKILKNIQKKIKANGLEYEVKQKINNQYQDITHLFKKKNFVLRRGPREDWYKDVLFVDGNLYEAGGKVKLNIHIEDSTGFHYTIDCSEKAVKKVRLLNETFVSVIRKYKENKPLEYELLDIYPKKEKYIEYKKFYESIQKNESLEKYDLLHDKIVSIIEDKNKSNGELLKIMRLFNYTGSDRGSIRTILIALKRVPKDDKLNEMYNSLAEILRAGNTNKTI